MSRERRYPDRETLAASLAGEVASVLESAVAERGGASLVVSGGSTPRPFFQALRGHRLPWKQVRVTLADERWVPPEDAESNERLVREELFVEEAAQAEWVGLKSVDPEPEAGATVAEERIAPMRPFDAVVLGMGTDGHTASLFPGVVPPEALDPEGRRTCVAVRPARPLRPRLSLTLAALIDSRRTFLHITGDEKWRVYREAARTGVGGGLPIGAVLAGAREGLEVHWAP